MRVRRPPLRLVAAGALFCVAILLALVATDVSRWQDAMHRDDGRYRATPAAHGLWRSPAILPGDPVRAIFGLGDPIAYRQLLQYFWLSELNPRPPKGTSAELLRIVTQQKLRSFIKSGGSMAERSAAANMLGVTLVMPPPAKKSARLQALRQATSDFRLAIEDDDASWVAKVNLELALRLIRTEKAGSGVSGPGRPNRGGHHGTLPIGGGF